MTPPRKGRGKSLQSIAIITAAIAILSEIQPATVRAVCYRLFVQKLIPNMSKASTDRVSKQLVYARENDLLDWDWIVDETREAETIASWDNPETLIGAAVNQYRKDYWTMQPKWVEVWSEKGTIRGTLAPSGPRPPRGHWPRAVCPSAPQGGSLSPRQPCNCGSGTNQVDVCGVYSLLY